MKNTSLPFHDPFRLLIGALTHPGSLTVGRGSAASAVSTCIDGQATRLPARLRALDPAKCSSSAFPARWST